MARFVSSVRRLMTTNYVITNSVAHIGFICCTALELEQPVTTQNSLVCEC